MPVLKEMRFFKILYNFFSFNKLKSTRSLAYTQADSPSDSDMHEWFDMLDYFFDKLMFLIFWGLGFFGLIVSNLGIRIRSPRYRNKSSA